MIEIPDTAEKLRAFMPVLDEMVQAGLVTLEGSQLISYRTSKQPSRSEPSSGCQQRDNKSLRDRPK